MKSRLSEALTVHSRWVLLGVIVIGLQLINPLIYSAYGIFEHEFVKLWFMYSMVLLGWLIIVFGRGKLLPVLPLSVIRWLIAFIGIYAIASFFGMSPVHSFLGTYGLWVNSLVSLLTYISIFYFAYILTVQFGHGFLQHLSFSMLSAAVLVSGKALTTKDGWSVAEFFTIDRIAAPFRNAHHLGFYLTIIFLFSFWMCITERKMFFRIIACIATLVSGFTLVMTYTRGSWIAAGTAVMLSLFLYRDHVRHVFHSRYIKTFLTICMLSLASFIPMMYQRLQATFEPGPRQSYRIRLQEWATSLRIWRTRPFLGIGPENLRFVYPKFRDKTRNLIEEEWSWRTFTTRNYWIELLVTTGPLGVITFFMFVRACLKNQEKRHPEFISGSSSLEMLKQVQHDKKHQYPDAGTIPYYAGMLAFLIHAFFYQVSASNFILFYTFAGVVAAQSYVRAEAKSVRLTKSIRAMIGILGCIGFFFLIRSAVGEYWKIKSLSVHNQDWTDLNVFAHEAAYTRATAAFPWYPYFDSNLRHLLYSQMLVLMDWHNDSMKRHSPQRSKELDLYLQRLNTLERRTLLETDNLSALATGYMRYAGFTDNEEEKAVMYEKAINYGETLITVDPTWPKSWDALGVVYLDAKQYDKALETFNHIINDLKPDYPFTYFHIGETYRQMGEPEKSIPYYEKAVALGYEGGLREIEEAKEEIRKKLITHVLHEEDFCVYYIYYG